MKWSRYVPLFALLLLALIWGYTWVPLKVGLAYSSPFPYAVLRTLPGGILLLAAARVLGRPLAPRPLGLIALLGVLQTSGFTGLTMGALVTGGAGHTAILANTWQFWILLIAWPLLGERLRGWQWVSVCLALAGLVSIIEPWRLQGIVSSLLTLAGAVSFAFSSIVAKVLRQRHRVDLLTLTGWQTLFGSIPLLLFALLLEQAWPHWTSAFNWSLAYTLVIGTCGGAVLWLYVLKRLPASIAGLGTMGTPVVGLLLSWAQLGEQPSLWEAGGMVAILIGLGILFAVSRSATEGDIPAPVAGTAPGRDASAALGGLEPVGLPGSSLAMNEAGEWERPLQP